MLKVIIFIVVFFLSCLSYSVLAAVPMASAWNLGENSDKTPEESPLLLEWNSSNDPNYIFYQNLPNVRPIFFLNERSPEFIPLMSFNTKSTPVQFIKGNVDINHLYIQWVGTPIFVYFGGSQSEGQVLAPTPGFIRAAHINGAKILGSIFFSPPAYGGDKEMDWLNAMLTKQPDGHFLYADQFIKIAHAYHFDGYFINQEAVLNNAAVNQKFVEFMQYFHENAPDLMIDWYQVPATVPTTQFLQPGINIFLDYGAPIRLWANAAKSINYSTENIEYGVNGINIYTLANMTSYLSNAVKYQMSIGYFAAENIAKQQGAPALNVALKNIDEFWNGNTTLLGVNAYMKKHSSITELPFFTDFNLGQGTDFFVHGDLMQIGQWNSTELQAILPELQHSKVFSPQYDLSNGYSGGSSFAINVSPHDSLQEYTLFSTQLKLQHDQMVLNVVYQNPSDSDMLCLTYDQGDEGCISLRSSTSWQHLEVELDDHASKTISALKIKSKADKLSHTLILGQIYIGKKQIALSSEMSVEYQSYLGKYFIQWQNSVGADYFDIYFAENGREQFIARTFNTFFCIDELPKGLYLVKGRTYTS